MRTMWDNAVEYSTFPLGAQGGIYAQNYAQTTLAVRITL